MEHQETLFPGESVDFRNLKLVRLARAYRGWAMTKESHIAMVGCLSGAKNLLRDTDLFQKEVDRMIDHLRDAQLKLMEFRVPESDIKGYFPYQVAPIKDNLIVATAHDSPAKPGFPGYKMIPPTAVTLPGAADSGPKGQFIIDPFAKKEKESTQGTNLVHGTIEIMVWDGNSSIGRKLPDPAAVTLKIGPSGLQEVGGEIPLLKQKLLAHKYAKVELSVKMSGKIEFDAHEKGLIRKWGHDFKTSLTTELHFLIKLKIEASVGVDTEGKVTPGLMITILEWE